MKKLLFSILLLTSCSKSPEPGLTAYLGTYSVLYKNTSTIKYDPYPPSSLIDQRTGVVVVSNGTKPGQLALSDMGSKSFIEVTVSGSNFTLAPGQSLVLDKLTGSFTSKGFSYTGISTAFTSVTYTYEATGNRQ